MQRLHFSIHIDAPKQRVWETMLAKDTYVKWTDVFSPNPGDESYFEGDWSEGNKMRFIGIDSDGKRGGMVSRIEKNDPYNLLSIKHIGILEGDEEITSGEKVKDWGNAYENYTFVDKDGGTELQIDVDSNDDFVEFFNESWPQGLEKLKRMVEGANTVNSSKVLTQLKRKYPGKAIFPNDQKNPTEILCEIEPTSEHPDYSLAISVIDRSVPHYHKQLTEEYKVFKGELKLHVGDEIIILHEGDNYTILPGTIHWAEGDETWIECRSTPGWTPGDHILV